MEIDTESDRGRLEVYSAVLSHAQLGELSRAGIDLSVQGESAGGVAAQLILEHQSGSNPQQIYLRVFVENSKWHAFARISIRRL